MVEIINLEITNFGSIKYLKLNMAESNMYIYKGPNGSGKSSVIGALTWCFYGKTLKPSSQIELWEDLREDDYSGTQVRVLFKSNGKKYTAVRCRNSKDPLLGSKGKNRLVIIHKQKQVLIPKNDKAQDYIDKLLGYSYNLFKSVILFGADIDRLAQKTNTEKKAIFEEAFELSFIAQLKDSVTVDKVEIQEGYLKSKYKLEASNKDILGLEDELEELKTERAELEENLESENIRLNLEIANNKLLVEKQINELARVNKSITKFKKKQASNEIVKVFGDYKAEQDTIKLSNEKVNLSEINRRISTVEKLISQCFYKEPKCSKCNQKLPQDKIKEYRDSIIAESITLKSLLDEEVGNKKTSEGVVASLTTILENTKETTKEQTTKDYTPLIDQWESRLKRTISHKEKLVRIGTELDTELNILNRTNFSKIDSQINSTEVELTLAGDIKITLKYDFEFWDNQKNLAEWALTDLLSNKGLKAHIFNTMLNKLNDQLTKYEKYIGMIPHLSIDLESASKGLQIDIYKGGISRSYADLSLGQKQLADLGIVFALADIQSLHSPINLKFIDEAFDHLDESNIEIVTQLLFKKAQKQTLHIVTHQKEFNFSSARVLRFELGSDQRTKVY